MTVRKRSLLKRLPAVVCAAFLLCVFGAAAVSADDSGSSTLYINPDTGYSVSIQDKADLMTDSEEAQLAEDMKAVTKYGSAAFVSEYAYGYSSSEYAELSYRRLIGSGSGTVLLIDMANRNIWIHSDGAIYKTITRSYANTITDNVYRMASK